MHHLDLAIAPKHGNTNRSLFNSHNAAAIHTRDQSESYAAFHVM